MDDEDLTAVLEHAGLSPYQAAAYVALLDLGSATATDVANACGVPDPRIYDVLRDLDERGYVETYQQDSLTVRAHDPEVVLSELRDRSSRYLTAAEAIEDRWNQPTVADHEISIVKRFETVLNRSREAIDDATDEIVLATTVANYREVDPELAGAVDRGVQVNLCLYTDGGPDELPSTDELAEHSTETRHRDYLGPNLLVVDRESTCFIPERGSINEYGILLNDPGHTEVFHWFFRSVLWETLETIYAESRTDPPITYVDLVECLREVVPLLSDGVAVDATVEGTETGSGERVTVDGRIVDTDHAGATLEAGDLIPLSPLAGPNSLTLETTAGERYEVGGRGSHLEDVEAHRITITDVGAA